MGYGAGLGSSYGAGGGPGYGAGRSSRSSSYGAGYVAGAFTPSSVSGLVAWFKSDGTLWQDSARTTPVVADADPVGSWDDASGNGNHIKQTTAGARPLFKTAIQNGRAVVRCDGTDDFLEQSGGSSWAQPNHIFIAFAKTTASASAIVLDGVTSRNAFLNSTGVNLFAGSLVATGQTFDTSFHQWSLLFSGAATVARLDQVAAGAVNAGTGALQNFLVGCDTGKASLFTAMDVGEILIYNAELTGSNLSNVENYLKARWGTP